MDRRTQRLRAASRCLARDGVRGLRVNDVAAEAGVSPGLLSSLFNDRSGLLGAPLDHIDTHADAVRARGARGGTTPGPLSPRHSLLAEAVARLVGGPASPEPGGSSGSSGSSDLDDTTEATVPTPQETPCGC